MLKAHGVEAFVSHCLSLLLERRLPSPELQTETSVVSRDRQIVDFVSDKLGPFEFICQYSGSNDFAENMRLASDLLERYRARAKLIVTTQLHCALPAIAMGIPVVVFFPPNTGAQHSSDLERFSSLSQIVPVFHLTQARDVDWSGHVVDISTLKLALLDGFYRMAERWRLPSLPSVGPVAPAEALQVSTEEEIERSLLDCGRMEVLRKAKVPDRLRWRNRRSYRTDWVKRSQMAAGLVPDHVNLLEIGVGCGDFRALVKDRCRYLGADLNPLDRETLALDLDSDPLPAGSFDYVVVLGVFEYLHWPEVAAQKLCVAAEHIVVSYCCRRQAALVDWEGQRDQHGWVNSFDEGEFVRLFVAAGKDLVSRIAFNDTEYFEQIIFEFRS
jgi:hypothetical protein